MRTSLASLFLLAFAAGCGDDSADDMAVVHDLTASVQDMAMQNEAGTGMVTLKLENYLSWCAVSVNGGTSSSTATQTLMFAPGTTVNLMGDKLNATFVWGYWRGTVGDTGAAHDTSMGTTVKMDGNKTVQACCPFASAPTDPCPDPT